MLLPSRKASLPFRLVLILWTALCALFAGKYYWNLTARCIIHSRAYSALLIDDQLRMFCVQDVLLKDLLYYRGRISTDTCCLSTFSDAGTAPLNEIRTLKTVSVNSPELIFGLVLDSGVIRGEGEGRTAPGDTLQGDDTRMKKNCGWICNEQWTNEVG